MAGDVGCGAVWGENLPCHTHPKVLLISSDVPAYEMIVGTVVTGNSNGFAALGLLNKT